MKTRSCILPLIALFIALGATAQEQKVWLRYKFTPGQMQRYTVHATGKLPVDLNPGPEAGLPAISLDALVDLSLTMEHKCEAVDEEGIGQIAMRIPALTARLSVAVPNQPMELLLQWQNGQLTNTVNGIAQPPDENAQRMAQALGETFRFRMKPTGEQQPDTQTRERLAALYNVSAMAGLDLSRLSALITRLPAEPVAPGARWQVDEQAEMPQGGLTAHSEMKFVGFEEFEDVQAARIEGQATLSLHGQIAPQGAPLGLRFNLTHLETQISFVNDFDPEAGVMLLSRANLVQNMMMILSMMPFAGGQEVNVPITIENAPLAVETRREKETQ